MDGGWIAVVIGLGCGLAATFAMRRYFPRAQRKPPLPPAPANRQQARKQQREAGKPRR